MNNDFKVVLNWLVDEFVNNEKQDTPGEEDIPIVLTIAFLTALTEGDSRNLKKSTEFLLKEKGSPSPTPWSPSSPFWVFRSRP